MTNFSNVCVTAVSAPKTYIVLELFATDFAVIAFYPRLLFVFDLRYDMVECPTMKIMHHIMELQMKKIPSSKICEIEASLP